MSGSNTGTSRPAEHEASRLITEPSSRLQRGSSSGTHEHLNSLLDFAACDLTLRLEAEFNCRESAARKYLIRTDLVGPH